MKDLERGNLQKTAFLDKDGNKVDLYISPLITKSELQLSEGIKMPPLQEGEKERIQFRVLTKEEIDERGFKLSGKKQEQNQQQTTGTPTESIPANTTQQHTAHTTPTGAGADNPAAQKNGEVVTNTSQPAAAVVEPKQGATQEQQGNTGQSEKKAGPTEEDNKKQQKTRRTKNSLSESEGKPQKQAKKKGLHH